MEAGLALSVEDDPVAAATALGRTYAELDPRLVRPIRSAAAEGFDATLEFEAWAQAYSATQPRIHEVLARVVRRTVAGAGGRRGWRTPPAS
ncbi:hypothetical protein GCM10009734_01140 [Nonomuraea bangladeshensis]